MKLDEITAQVRFMGRQRIETEEDLHRAVQEIRQRMEQITEERKGLRNEVRKPSNQNRMEELKGEVSQKTRQLAELRKELKMCEQIAERSRIMQENMKQIQRDREAEKRKESQRDDKWR